MKDSAKTKKQLLDELVQLRQRIAQLETLQAKYEEVAKEAKLKDHLLDKSTDSIIIRDADAKIVYANETAYKSRGYTREEFLGMTIYQLLAPGQKGRIETMSRDMLKQGTATFETIHARKDGSLIPIEVNRNIIELGGKIFSVTISRDITERKKAEEELKLKEQILDKASDSIMMHDLDGNIVYANEMAYKSRRYTREELLTMNIRQLFLPVKNELFEARTREAQEQGPTTFESTSICKDGSSMPVEVNMSAIESGGKKFIIAISRDITERKRMQDRLIITDRLAALGEMSLGFAHELNNPLTSVIGYAQLLLEDKSLAEPVRTDVERIHSQAQRTATIIKDFVVFARAQPSIKEPIELNMVMSNVLKLRDYELKLHNINIITRLSPYMMTVMADAAQLQQVFLDIIINAEYFMLKAHKKGTLTITTEKIKDRARISIADDGPGIPQENLSKIFNPFFTTKEVGQGTGLGLSICHGIINEHGGRIYAESKPGEGATFIIELPLASG